MNIWRARGGVYDLRLGKAPTLERAGLIVRRSGGDYPFLVATVPVKRTWRGRRRGIVNPSRKATICDAEFRRFITPDVDSPQCLCLHPSFVLLAS